MEPNENTMPYTFIMLLEENWGSQFAVKVSDPAYYDLCLPYCQYWGEISQGTWALIDSESGDTASNWGGEQ